MTGNRTAFWLSVFTVAYNLVEGVVSVGFSVRDNSAGLLGFGADSFVESMSGAVMVWRFWQPAGAQHREERAARLVGLSFLALAVYVAYEATTVLVGSERPDRSIAALVIAVLSLVVMSMLFWCKRRAAMGLGSRSLLADSKQTLACMFLSVALLVGSGLNYWMGLWQADPIAGLLIALYLLREGYVAIATREVCAC
jgi:predicted Co/Zn/Cd cation transporter (cation efflux family)